jgi:hypothetical protein
VLLKNLVYGIGMDDVGGLVKHIHSKDEWENSAEFSNKG